MAKAKLPLPKFSSFQVVVSVDQVNSKDLQTVYAIDEHGWIWRKYGGKPWRNISNLADFTTHEEDQA